MIGARFTHKLLTFHFKLVKTNSSSFRKYSTITMPDTTFSKHHQIKKVINNIIKSEQDKRQYRGLELTNGMKILLISDPTTDKSAASVDVHIGAMSDPRPLPGLAHFLEHMLFLGTEKYPSENEYSKFLKLHGGSSNAYTAGENTSFFFNVVPDHLRGALDRFAQFFLSPTFTESATDREVKAVNSEHEKNVQSDLWRFYQLEKSLSDPDHDYNKFHTGNKKTLDELPKSKGINVREELLKFHKKWYSSNIMTLAVLGKENLDQLTELVLEYFPDIENKNVQIPVWNTHPLREEDLKTKSVVVPVKDIRSLSVTFPTPDLHPYYKTNPGHYLGHLAAHEGRGSLLSELKSQGWVDSITGDVASSTGFGFFSMRFGLTEEGIDHVEEIISMMFQYLNLLKKEGPKEWIFNECKDIAEMMFRFKDKEDPAMFATACASSLHDYPLHEVLSGVYLLEEYKPEIINMLLSKLTPENIKVFVVGQKFETEADQSEKWYGTKYKIEPIKSELIELWKKETFNENLNFPEKNDFIPTNFDIVEREKKASSVPILIKNTEMSKVWFKQDNEFMLPKAVFKVHFINPLAYSDPLNYGFTNVFIDLFEDYLNEYSYAAQIAGLAYGLFSLKSGILLQMNGYSHKLKVLLEKILDSLTSFDVDPKKFDIFKEKFVRGVNNFKARQPYKQSFHYSNILLSQNGWSNDDVAKICDEITFEKIKAFIPELLSKMCLECLCHGNVTEQQSLDMVSIVEQKLQERMKTKHLHPSQLIAERAVQLPFDSSFVFERENPIHSSSCTQCYYQYGQQSTNNNILADLYAQIISEPCFNILRTQEQLGYIVYSGIHNSHGVLGLNVLIQSEFPPSYIDGRIESFLNSMEDFIKDISEEDFQQNKTSLAEKRLEKPKTVSEQSRKYWAEIISQQYNFDRDTKEVEELNSVSKEDVLDFHKKLVSLKSTHRRKLSFHVVSTLNCDSKTGKLPQQEGLTPAPELPKPTVVDDIPSFKSSLALFPVVKPAISIPKPTSTATKSKL